MTCHFGQAQVKGRLSDSNPIHFSSDSVNISSQSASWPFCVDTQTLLCKWEAKQIGLDRTEQHHSGQLLAGAFVLVYNRAGRRAGGGEMGERGMINLVHSLLRRTNGWRWRLEGHKLTKKCYDQERVNIVVIMIAVLVIQLHQYSSS